jgi:death-on-curing family protein
LKHPWTTCGINGTVCFLLARRIGTVGELAQETGLDEDEVLIRLWEAGLDQYTALGNRVPRRDRDAAQRALELPTRKELQNPAYWCRVFDTDDSGLRALLQSIGLPMSPSASALPRGAIAKLRAQARSRCDSPDLRPQQHVVVEREPAAESPHEWRVIGHRVDRRLLTQEEVEAIHWVLVEDFVEESDPIDPPGVRSDNLLGSAVFRQHTGAGGDAKYPTAEMAAAALLHSIVHDHPFHNGNKRTALVSMLVLLDENGIMLTCEEDELFKLVVRLAQHKIVRSGRDLPDREMDFLAEWICENSRLVEKGDRAIQWRRLRQMLSAYGCEISHSGTRVNIERTVEEKSRLGRIRRTPLRTQIKYTDDGREAQVHSVKKIRKDLQLDDEHGIDSQSFYRRPEVAASGFILKYRKTLKRLARL